jgi:hypothetical protein
MKYSAVVLQHRNYRIFYCPYIFSEPITVAVRSKAYVSRHLGVGITGSNPSECMDVCLLYLLRFV